MVGVLHTVGEKRKDCIRCISCCMFLSLSQCGYVLEPLLLHIEKELGIDARTNSRLAILWSQFFSLL